MNFSVQNQTNITQIQAHLNKHPFLSEGSLPGTTDAKIFQSLHSVPDKNTHPNFYHWYVLIKQFSPSLLKSWELRDEETQRKIEQTLQQLPIEPKKSSKKIRLGTKDKFVFEVIFKNESDYDEVASSILLLDIAGQLCLQQRVQWFKDTKKIVVPGKPAILRVSCLLDEDKTSLSNCMMVIQGSNKDIDSVTPIEVQ